eukprot:TRINITY_DN14057_c0_g1_i1.p1 TRINITY_DN14057_c0_g1~~TRINITY_DN14057_c0_g1_i1.p1  ORF type:complete len:1020 (-),score=272.62 TRINITY_DN14057_c0_g1_i1:64-3123(-)
MAADAFEKALHRHLDGLRDQLLAEYRQIGKKKVLVSSSSHPSAQRMPMLTASPRDPPPQGQAKTDKVEKTAKVDFQPLKGLSWVDSLDTDILPPDDGSSAEASDPFVDPPTVAFADLPAVATGRCRFKDDEEEAPYRCRFKEEREDSDEDDFIMTRMSSATKAVTIKATVNFAGEEDDEGEVRLENSMDSVGSDEEGDRKEKSRRLKSPTGDKMPRLGLGLGNEVLRRKSVTSNTARPEESAQFEVLPVWLTGKLGIANRRVSQFVAGGRSKTLAGQDFGHEATQQSCSGTSLQVKDRSLMSNYMVHPSSWPCLLWNCIGLLLICYDCVVLPLEVFGLSPSAARTILSWLTRFYWTLNMAVSCFTGFLKDDGSIEMRPKKVIVRYLSTWFVLDAVVVFVDWIEVTFKQYSGEVFSGGANRIGNLLRTMRMVRLLRLLRVAKAPEILEFINEHIRSEEILLMGTIVKIIFMMVAVAHFVACMWWGIGTWDDQSADSWVIHHGLAERRIGTQYMVSFHWSLAQFAGELLYEPRNGSERFFTIFVLFGAIIFSAGFVSSLTTAMTRLQIVTGQQAAQLSTLRRWLLDQNISRALAARVQQNAQHTIAEQKKNVPEAQVELLKFISTPLLVELHFEMYFKIISKHPFFDCYDVVNPSGMRRVCHDAVSLLSLSNGDILFSNLEVPQHKRMFFVLSGCLDYVQEIRATQTVDSSCWMCEALLWTSWSHQGTARASSKPQDEGNIIAGCRLLEVNTEKFQSICGDFQTEHASTYATEFVSFLNQVDDTDLTDLNTLEDDLLDMIELAFDMEDDEDWEESDDEDDKPRLRPSGRAAKDRKSTNSNANGGVWRPSTTEGTDSRGGLLGLMSSLGMTNGLTRGSMLAQPNSRGASLREKATVSRRTSIEKQEYRKAAAKKKRGLKHRCRQLRLRVGSALQRLHCWITGKAVPTEQRKTPSRNIGSFMESQMETVDEADRVVSALSCVYESAEDIVVCTQVVPLSETGQSAFGSGISGTSEKPTPAGMW